MLRRLRRTAILATILGSLSSGAAWAEPVEEFYHGRSITIIVGQSAGGTYDLYARAIAHFLGKHIPGRPNVIVQNMVGAAGLTAALRVIAGPQDGTIISASTSTLPFQSLIDKATSKFAPQSVSWLPSPASYGALMVVGEDAPAQSIKQMRTAEMRMGALAPRNVSSILLAATNTALHLKLKPVFGYQGVEQAMLALSRKEVDGYPVLPFDVVKRKYASAFSRGEIKAVLQYSAQRSPEFPDVPLATELADSNEDRELIELATMPLSSGYPYFTGLHVPADRLAALKEGLLSTFNDADFLKECATLTLTVAPATSEEFDQRVRSAYGTTNTVVEKLRELYSQQQ